MRNFLELLGPHRSSYFLVTFFMALVTGSEVVIHPLLLKAIFDGVSRHEPFNQFVHISLAYLALGLTVNPLSYLVSLWQLKVDNRVVGETSERLLASYFDQNYGDLLKEGSGYYVARIRSDVKDGLVPMLSGVREVIIGSMSFVLLISVLVYISWRAFLILAIIIPISTGVSIWVSRRIRVLTKLERDYEASVIDVLTRAISAFKIVRTFAMIPKTIATFGSALDQSLNSNYRKYRVVRSLQGAGDLTMVISDVCSMTVGAYLVIRNQLTLGSFIAFMNAFWRSATTLIQVFNKVAELHGHSAVVDRLVEFIDQRHLGVRYTVGDEVRAAGIGFSYGNDAVLSNFSLAVKPGGRSLIVGRNGTGKTTLANILCGHLAPSSGCLQLPKRISAVTLPLHFPPTLVRELPIDEHLLSMFGIVDTALLDARPDALSAGQQQKVALALALSRDADLYVLDEPLANLDSSSRTIAMQEIMRCSQDRMLLMIMHNADEYLSIFDQVYSLGEEGGIDGSREPLAVVGSASGNSEVKSMEIADGVRS